MDRGIQIWGKNWKIYNMTQNFETLIRMKDFYFLSGGIFNGGIKVYDRNSII